MNEKLREELRREVGAHGFELIRAHTRTEGRSEFEAVRGGVSVRASTPEGLVARVARKASSIDRGTSVHGSHDLGPGSGDP